ncbi:MAG: transglutaminase domain-containing protein [Pseudomonadota bacterium]
MPQRSIHIELQSGAPPGAKLLVPTPIDDWQCRFTSAHFSGLTDCTIIRANNSGQQAMLLTPETRTEAQSRSPIGLHYRFEVGDTAPSAWIWQRQENALTQASSALAEFAQVLIKPHADATTEQKLRVLVDAAHEMFDYGHVDAPFNAGTASVPVPGAGAKGSCVDINTFLLAAAQAVGIRGQYIAGYWFHPTRTFTHDMHCWLAFDVDGGVQFWDVAHHLKWGVADLAPGLNPAGGRRVPMSAGRGIEFTIEGARHAISHLSEPVWICPDASHVHPELTVHVTDPVSAHTLVEDAA